MTTDEADPVPLAPYAWSDGDLGVELDTHLEIAFQAGFGYGEGLRGGRSAALETADHGIKVSLLGRLGRRVLGRGAIDSLVQDRVVRVVFFHGVEEGRTLEEMGALTAGVLGSNGLTVVALCGQALPRVSTR